ncbi:MAG: T9SS C-terminal target domain-containing protein, partial [Bacteroidetes bacterium]
GDDTEDSVCLPFLRPAMPKVVDDYDRTVTYTNVSINGSGNVFYATPGQSLQLSGQFQSVVNANMQCPGCITQLHIGMGNGSTNFFSRCYEVTGGTSGVLGQSFNAPTTPGIYYITHINTWWYFCNQFTLGNHKVSNNNKFAIAVVIVSAGGTTQEAKISAGLPSEVDLAAPVGTYPITLSACDNYNPNYRVILQNGTLTLTTQCFAESRNWLADGNFNEQSGNGNGTPVGGVTAAGEGKVGSGSFSFNGESYISTETGGSVSGTGNFSVSAWVKTNSENPMVVIQQRGNQDIDGEYILKIGGRHNVGTFDPEATGKAYFFVYDFANNLEEIEVFSTTRINDGNWHLIKGERIGTRMNIYVDGRLEGSANSDGVVNLKGSIPTYIGGDLLDFSAYFDGLIDDVRVRICADVETASAPKSAAITMLSAKPSAPKQTITANKLYPNPATNSIRIALVQDVAHANDISVVDVYGKLGQTPVKKIDAGIYELQVSRLPQGLYFVKAKTASGMVTLKFIKM